MTITRTLATSFMSLSTAALFALSSAGGATAAPVSPEKEDVPGVSSTRTAGTAEPDYWTPERMRAAIPGEVLAKKALARQKANTAQAEEAVSKGADRKIKGSDPAVLPLANASENPVPHIGKVFFTLGGADYVCSANSVASTNRNTVSTAGHCLNEGPGTFATRFTFVPAYLNGAAPYGKWTAKALYAPTQWSSSGSMQYDTGFAVVSQLNGRNLADVVGTSGVRFNAARGLGYKAFGYPAAPPFNGESLKSCTGTAANDPYNPQFNTQGIPCNMTGGSSGGPWFIGTSSGGYQNSVNSYGYGSNSTTMYGPYWGSVIQSTYNAAAAAS
jgi:V8-like Glu-specific endopeptidase